MDKENDPPEGYEPSHQQMNHDLQGEDVGFGGHSNSESDAESTIAHNGDPGDRD